MNVSKLSCSGLVLEDSDVIGFVVWCLFSSAIDRSELRLWCTDVVIRDCTVDKIPSYIFDLMSFDDSLFRIVEVIGFVPPWEPTEYENGAIYGLAAARGRLAEDAPITADEAKKMLKSNVEVFNKFKLTFPFIAIDI